MCNPFNDWLVGTKEVWTIEDRDEPNTKEISEVLTLKVDELIW